MKTWIDVAKSTAIEAGRLLLNGFYSSYHVAYKGEIDLVTDMDKQSEQLIVTALTSAFPDHTIVTEEEAAIQRSSSYVWYIDPLDGTTNYAHAFPVFCVSIALWVEDKPAVAVVYDPVKEELFEAARMQGAFLNGKRLSVSNTPDLCHALLATGFPYDIRVSDQNNLDHFSNLSKKCQGVRRLGAAALDMCYVAAGRLDGFWEAKLKPWDTAAGTLLIQEAGGRVTDFYDTLFHPMIPHIVATNGKIHQEIIQTLQLGHTMVGVQSD